MVAGDVTAAGFGIWPEAEKKMLATFRQLTALVA